MFEYKLFNWLFRQVSAGKMQLLLLPSDKKSGYWYRMALQMLYIMTLTYVFKVTKFDMWISWKRWELATAAQVWLLQRLIFAIELDHCDTPCSQIFIFKVKHFFVMHLLKKMCAGSGYPWQICPRREVSLVTNSCSIYQDTEQKLFKPKRATSRRLLCESRQTGGDVRFILRHLIANSHIYIYIYIYIYI